MGFLSDRSVHATNVIEELNVVAEALEGKGKKVIKINKGNPPLYFHTPRYIVDAYIRALKEGQTGYSRPQGIEPLQEAVASRYRRLHKIAIDPEDVIVTQGISESLNFINSALINPGDGAVIFTPCYPPYISNLKLSGGEIVHSRYDEENGWGVDTDHLERQLRKIKKGGKLKRLKYMIITNPNNPTGTVLKRGVLEEVVRIANEFGIFLISDEIYDEIIYNGASFTSVAKLAGGMPHLILNGLSKDFDAPGFKIGFSIIPEGDRRSAELREKLIDYCNLRLSASTPAQYAAVEALNNERMHRAALRAMVPQIEGRANHTVKRLEENPYLSVVRPNGAFYLFPKVDLKALGFKDDRAFARKFLEKELVQLTSGSGFGCPAHIRIVALPPKEILDYAMDKLNHFCRSNARG